MVVQHQRQLLQAVVHLALPLDAVTRYLALGGEGRLRPAEQRGKHLASPV
ncbi:MAG: hypothetical protein U1E59_11545 [Amaricoccus sp.]